MGYGIRIRNNNPRYFDYLLEEEKSAIQHFQTRISKNEEIGYLVMNNGNDFISRESRAKREIYGIMHILIILGSIFVVED